MQGCEGHANAPPDETACHAALRAGFTLIELSIVLVVIGLIVGGVLVGKDLITQARDRTIVSEFTQFQTAVMDFQGKYQGIPGDITNATSFWGTMAGGCPSSNSSSPQTGTCNGNGDGRICSNNACSSYQEIALFWQQLADAGLISGQYSGTTGPGCCGARSVLGLNTPVSSYSSTTGWTAYTTDTFGGIGFPKLLSFTNVMEFGTVYQNNQTYGPALTAVEAFGIDSKIDDGNPGTGNVQSLMQGVVYTPNCASTNNASTAVYDQTQSNPVCSLFFNGGF